MIECILYESDPSREICN